MSKVFCPKCDSDVDATKFHTNYAGEDKIRYTKVRCLACDHIFVNSEGLHSKSLKEFNEKGLSKKLQYSSNGKRRSIYVGKRTPKSTEAEQGKQTTEADKAKRPKKKTSRRRIKTIYKGTGK